MSHTLFIADLHLDDARPQITELFERYLAGTEVCTADALYILGDLVEAWIGDDDDAALPARIASAILALHDVRVPVYFMVGNRDFLLGEDYAHRAGFQILPDGTVHTLYGLPTLLMHGDALCTDDVVYQNTRRQLRSAEWMAWFLAMPLQSRRAFAAQARDDSKAHIKRSMASIMDINFQTMAQAMSLAGVTRLIHGHTHRPAIHHFRLNGRDAQRIVVGDWYRQGSVLTVTPEKIELRKLHPDG